MEKRQHALGSGITDPGMKLVEIWLEARTKEIGELYHAYLVLLVQGFVLWILGFVIFIAAVFLSNHLLTFLGAGVIALSGVWYGRQAKAEAKFDRAVGTLKGANEVLELQVKALLSETKSIRNDIKAKKETK
jgi:hypothetical protein